jgi:hypothetical protein
MTPRRARKQDADEWFQGWASEVQADTVETHEPLDTLSPTERNRALAAKGVTQTCRLDRDFEDE